MANFEARNGPFALYADGVYILVNASGSITMARDISPRVSAALSAALDVRFQMGIAETGAAYEVARFGLPISPTTTVPVAFDVLAGARFWHQQLDFSFKLAGMVDINALALRGGRPDLGGNRDRAIAKSGTID